jgi:hypothetical protein
VSDHKHNQKDGERGHEFWADAGDPGFFVTFHGKQSAKAHLSSAAGHQALCKSELSQMDGEKDANED